MRLSESLSIICDKLGIKEFSVTLPHPFVEIEKSISGFSLSGFCEADIKKRIAPSETMADCKSIICVLFPYKPVIQKDIEGCGSIVSGDVGFGCDYHVYVKERLDIISRELRGCCLPFSDTGPLVDKEVAVRSGLCQYGRNSLAINKRYGSMFYIGYILTDIAADGVCSDKRGYELCVNCAKCIEACPSNALSAGGMRHDRCISYISQKKGVLTKEEASLLGNNLYGCHVCQNVCPANNGTKYELKVDLGNCVNLTNRGFKSSFSGTAASWLGKKTFERNALVVRENIKDRGRCPHPQTFQ
jgi:epoxyqueuosine reductase